jgi:hypothetical protein
VIKEGALKHSSAVLKSVFHSDVLLICCYSSKDSISNRNFLLVLTKLTSIVILCHLSTFWREVKFLWINLLLHVTVALHQWQKRVGFVVSYVVEHVISFVTLKTCRFWLTARESCRKSVLYESAYREIDWSQAKA